MADANRELQILLTMKDKASKELSGVSNSLENVNKDAGKASNGFAGFARNIAATAAAFISFKKIYDGFALGIRVAADLQTAEVGLTTLLGSAEEAHATVQRLKEEAKRTPFELPGLTQATQLLTSVTKDGNKSIKILLDVGEALAAMGKGQSELDRIIVNLQQVAAVGHAATIDIKQFAFAGIPIYEMLSEATGKYGDELNELIQNGGVTFDLLTRMFDEANNEGGRFFGAFENQSGTFNQALSNMKDSVGIFFADIVQGTGIFNGLTQAMITVSDWLNNCQENMKLSGETVRGFIQTIDDNTGAITILKTAWDNIVTVFRENLLPVVAELWEALTPLKPFLEVLAKIIGVILYGAFVAVVKLIEVSVIATMQILTGVIQKITSAVEFFKNMWDSVIETLSKVIDFIDRLIEKIKSLNILQGAKNAISSVLGFGGGKASGGSVSANKSYLVGEEGPELFTPGASGAITPNNKLMGSGGASIVVNVYGDVSGQELIQKVSDGIMNSLRLNGRLAI